MKPYVDHNVGHQLHYIKMNVGRVDHATQPPIPVFSLYLQIYSSALYTYFITYLNHCILYLKIVLMLLTVMFAQPGLSSPTWNLLIWSQGSNLEARSTWWRPTTSHAHNQESKIKSHHTNSDKFPKNIQKSLLTTLLFAKICQNLSNISKTTTTTLFSK